MDYTLEEAARLIRDNAKQLLQKDKQGTGFICPICGSGAHKDGITTKDGKHFTCWAGDCFKNADYIDIVGLQYGIDSYPAKVRKAAELYGITIADAPTPVKNDRYNDPTYYGDSTATDGSFADFIKRSQDSISSTDYLQRRGISEATQQHFGCGYCEAWRSPAALRSGKKPPATPRVIIPTGAHSYLARAVRQEDADYKALKEGGVNLFNFQVISSDTPGRVFICEGEIDAMSYHEAGVNAVALGSTSNVNKLLALLAEYKPQQEFILALDSDEAGRNAEAKLAEGLSTLGIHFYRIRAHGSSKDANEALCKNRAAFIKYVRQLSAAADIPALLQDLQREKYASTNSAAAHLQEFVDGIASSVNTPCIKTGFTKLDEALDGGLYEGLYTIGAVSSLGKTTLVLQAADQIAQSGQDVLIFSLEMARTELMAKSISRLTAQTAVKQGMKLANAKTTRGITSGARYASYSKQETQLIQDAVKAYESFADHIYIVEGVGDIGVTQIRETVEQHISYTGKSPVIVIDYLQILSPYNERATDKQNTDKAVLELKRISRDYKTPVIAISSLNRDNYSTRINLAAFKESGAIEYGADTVLGLQFAGAGSTNFNLEEAAKEEPRKIELVILKQRNGRRGDTISFKYNPMFNLFRED